MASSPKGIVLATLIDAVSFLYLGFRDITEYKFEWEFVPLFAVVPIMVLVFSGNVLAWVVAAAEVAAVLALVALNYTGYGDLLAFLRIGVAVVLLYLLGVVPLVVLLAAAVASVWAVVHLTVSPYICGSYRLFARTRPVKREHFMRPNVFPLTANIRYTNDDYERELERVKMNILRNNRSECIEAYIGAPLVTAFSWAYLAMAVSAAIMFWL